MMPSQEEPDTLSAALEAYDAGLCVVRAAIDGTKKPVGQWKQYQTARPDREQVEAWFADGYPGIGVICGAVSGNLEMLELEGRFMDEVGADKFFAAVKKAGLELLFRKIAKGYQTISPSGGRHFTYRVSGPIDGNTKLARRPSSSEELTEHPNAPIQTLIETRGEGGFVVVAPSGGPVHPTGKPWLMRHGGFGEIVTITPAERDALFDVCRSFDEAPPAPVFQAAPPAQRSARPSHQGVVGESWFDAVVAHLSATTSVRDELERFGWTYCYTDQHGRELLRRPGKDQGVSASINASGRMHPFSTSVPFEVGGRPARTYDVLDVIAAYEFGGNRNNAARSIAEQTGILPAWNDRQTTTPPPNVDPTTGEITKAPAGVNLPEEFWAARPVLQHIRQAAHARLVSADAVLLAVLARAVMLTPPSVVLPAIVGDIASINLFGAIVDPSGGGKSASHGAAKRILAHERKDVVDPILPSSGEGLIEAFFDWVEEEGDDGKKRKVKRQVKTAGFAWVDEGQSLLAQADRSGTTIMETIRSGWLGGDLGQHNAAEDRKRWLAAHKYRLCMVVGFQLQYAANLIADGEGGTPQRFTFALATDPSLVDGVEWPGPLRFDPPPMLSAVQEVVFAPEIVAGIRQRRVARQQGSLIVNPLDTHADVRKMKLATALALIDGSRLEVTVDDWELAEMMDATSCAVRQRAIDYSMAAFKVAQRAANERTAERERVVEAAAIARTIERVARLVAKKVWRDGPMSPASAFRVTHSRDRVKVDVDDAIELAVARGWLSRSGADEVARGGVEP